ncbi:synergin gamma isoform X1 [Pantherophis guttatus]|uniref:Synergin gamma isoform X1 n=1 Tax=Pantherophis guttatus TaxID=94885 RepID=A0ABM3ZLE4_PANGU|nr:synergin gamma isoform X1 [Pantherophis guttatus]
MATRAPSGRLHPAKPPETEERSKNPPANTPPARSTHPGRERERAHRALPRKWRRRAQLTGGGGGVKMALRPAGLGAGAAPAGVPTVSAGPPGMPNSTTGGAGAATAAAAAAAGSPGPASFVFPVTGGLGPQGMIPMQQQSFSMVPVMQPNMQGMMGMNYGSQMPPGTMTVQGGMPLGAMPTAGMPYMGQSPFLGMRAAAPQYTPDMRKQFVEEQQKRFEHQQKVLEEERKRRQFEEQKQKLRLLSSVKPKMGEKSRDDALEAIKGNLDGFSRDAKLHPTPTAHPKNADHPKPSHSTVSVSQTTAFLDDEEFSDFIQGPVETPPFVPPTSSQPFQSCHPGQRLSEKAAAHPLPPVQFPVTSVFQGTVGPVPYFSPSPASQNSQKTGCFLEDKPLAPRGLSEFGQTQIKLKAPEVELSAAASAVNSPGPQLAASGRKSLGALPKGAPCPEANKASEPKLPVQECGVGVFPSQDPIQQMMPPWIYNDNLIPDLYKKILETTMTSSGIDTGKLYPILMSSGLPRETLGQIWALANRTTPGKLTKEELYTVLAMIALTQRGMPAMSPDGLNQFPSAPIPTLSGLQMAIPVTVSQQPLMPPGPPVSMPLNIGPTVVGISMAAPVGGVTTQTSSSFIQHFPANQVAKIDDDDFQDFQDASKSGGLDDTFTDFQGEAPGSKKTLAAQQRSSAPSMLIPLSGPKVTPAVDKYAVFKGIASDKPAEDYGDKYSAFRELEQPSESKSIGESFADFKSPGTDDGFTDFKTADSISPLEPPTKDKAFPSSFSSLSIQSKPQPQAKPSLNLADLDLFSSASTGESQPALFPSAYSSPKLATFATPSHTISAATTLPAPGSGSALAGNFADFNLFGGLSSCPSATTQDEFADFMAFNNNAVSLEQQLDDKYGVLKQEANSVPSTGSLASAMKNGQSPIAASNKYDIFKQLSLDSPGLGFEDLKDHTPSSVKSEDDFADFHSSKFSSSSEKSLVDKLAAFKHTKEDSASVKSLDLPSIGGSSVGKEDSEDALSVQFDMKLADVGGDLKHVLSDSSLDLPMVSGQHPPAADLEDLKGAPFGTYSSASLLSSFPSCDWSDKEDVYQSRRSTPFSLPAGNEASLATSVLQKKETFFGSSENITVTTVSKVTTFANEDALQDVKFSSFANFQSSSPHSMDQSEDEVEDFGEFAQPPDNGSERPPTGGSQEADSAPVSSEAGKEVFDDFGEFQGEKPKISKFDFLLATSQGKMKSSEEMIKSELATFDLSVQGSHKRTLSLGSSPLPPVEQPFRDRSNTLSEKPSLPVIRDKYKDLTGEVEESERYAYEWQRCLESALQVIKKANDILNGISSSSVCTEVIQSVQGMEYLLGVVEVYRVTKRVELGIKATAVCSEKLQLLLKDIDKVWNNLIGFMSLAALTPDENSLDFSSCMLRPGIKNAQELACGVCLLNVNSRSKAFNSATDSFKLAYGGHQYHASCANFWINCVEPKPPGLLLPDLL